MRIQCTIGVSTRTARGIHQTRKPAKANVSIFQKNNESFIQIFTEKCKNQGEKYKLRNNLISCRNKFISDGKLTIELKDPAINLMILKAEPRQLGKLIMGLKSAFKGETLVGHGILFDFPSNFQNMPGEKPRIYRMSSTFFLPSAFTFSRIV